MEIADPTSVAPRAKPSALLVSLHDVSPLTLEDCRVALALLHDAGLRPEELTVLVIPCHEGQVRVDQHPPTVAFLRALADDGASLVMHGLTHRMRGRALTPGGFLRGHIFARGQGELLRATAAETALALEEGATILRAAGLEQATRAFVPPAWLLSVPARAEVARAGFDFYELFGGIVHAQQLHARRVIGWGSLNPVESVATAAYSWAQLRLPVNDTRVAVHPADMRRPFQCRAILRAVGELRALSRPCNYPTFLRARTP